MGRRLTRCEQHEMSNLAYLAAFEDAEIRMARGERQYKCAECGLWQWPRLSPKEPPRMDDIARAAGVTRERVRQLVETAALGTGDCIHLNQSPESCGRCAARITLREMGYFTPASPKEPTDG